MNIDEMMASAFARRNLLDFATRMYPRFDQPPHLRLIAGLLEQVERGELRKLQISVPVRHGKSVLASQLFAAWYVGKHPDRNVVLASHSEELAVRNSRAAKHFLEDDRWPFEGVELSTDSSAAGRWNTKQGGGVYAIGAKGAITGRGADLLIIDDALHDGLSETERQSVYEWYTEVAVPRVEPGGAVIVIGARFAEDDLCGRILESEDGPNWRVVNLPALAEENDPIGRPIGAPLWPDRFSLAELEERRVSMGSRAFFAQFQQQPVNANGAFFKLEWFDNRYEGGIPQSRIREYDPIRIHDYTEYDAPIRTVLAIDCASKTGIGNDYSALVSVATDSADFYVFDVVRERLEFADLIRTIIEAHKKWDHDYVVIEDASAGIAVAQELRRWTNLSIIPITPQRSKVVRAESISPFFESKRVRLPHNAHWLADYLAEFLRFPVGRHDDMVDATVLGITQCDALNARDEQMERQAYQLRGWMQR